MIRAAMDDVRFLFRNALDILALKCSDAERALAAAEKFQKALEE
jgi:hypothetical protein